jgi:hypothetical protein
MKNYFISAAASVLMMLFTLSCQNPGIGESAQVPSKVEIRETNGKHHFYVNGELFELKGAGGGGNLKLLQQSGGNSIRTWSPNNGRQVLDSAMKYNIMVAMGIGMGQELHHFDYNDEAKVEAQFQRNIRAIDTLKNHPALLCWVIGNELNLSPDHKTPVNPKVWDALKDMVDYIHREDGNHPVTTAFAGVNRDQIEVALKRCPNLDFISVQVYGGLGSISRQVQAAGITRPFAVTEYGPIGHWEMPQTAWGREIEEPSALKATGLYERIQQGIVNDPTGLCLGGYAFLWGQKQERTPTWYGIFLKTGEATAVVDELTRYWSGQYPDNRAPMVDDIRLNDKKAVENVYVKPGERCVARVNASDPDGDQLTFEWVILKEVIERSQGGARELEPEGIRFESLSESNGELVFTAPAEKGEYRLFSYVYDGNNKAGTANIPFMVE